jgi:hypothetical protein
MVKEDFFEHGFSIVLPDDPSYGSELQKLGLSGNPGVERLRPFSVVVKNTSQRTVVAFGIRWTKRDPAGNVATDDGMYMQPHALLDGGRVRYDRPLEGVIQPRASRLLTVAGMVQTIAESKNLSLHPLPDVSHWSIEKVELDSAVFDDGEAIGPDKLEVVKRLKARVDAQQDLLEEVSNRVANGELLHNVLQELQKTALSQTQPGTLTKLDLDDVYGLVRQQYLDELAATETNVGEEAANRRIQQLKYVRRPAIRQAMAGGK